MKPIYRRDFLKFGGFMLAGSRLEAAEPQPDLARWLTTCRILIREAYSMRYPAASYFAYFPTKSGYPVHPELKDDPMREMVERCRAEGMRVVAYVPLNPRGFVVG